MNRRTNRFVASATLLGTLALSSSSRAADNAPAAEPPQVEASTPWRSYAFPVALGAAGVSLISAISFKRLMDKRSEEFNSFGNPMPTCRSGALDYGGGECARLHDQADSAERWLKISMISTGAFAVAALVFKLTEPKETGRTPVLACAPGLGMSASCRVTF